MKEAMPEIVRAQIERAKAGSLSHTKWLWSVADQARSASEKPEEVSLGKLLVGHFEAQVQAFD